MSVKRKVWIVCMACMIGCFPVSAQSRIEPADLPILAWYGIPAHEATVERFEELRDAGFTLNFRSFPSADAVAKGLDAAGKAGIKLIIGCPELEKEPEKTVRRFMNHSALAGYFLRDEPRSNEFAELGEWARRIQAVDNEHFCYLNLFPTGPKEHLDQLGVKSYREYVSRFDEQVPLPFLTFDHYPITRDGLKAEWYENLEEFSDEARKAGQARSGLSHWRPRTVLILFRPRPCCGFRFTAIWLTERRGYSISPIGLRRATLSGTTGSDRSAWTASAP